MTERNRLRPAERRRRHHSAMSNFLPELMETNLNMSTLPGLNESLHTTPPPYRTSRVSNEPTSLLYEVEGLPQVANPGGNNQDTTAPLDELNRNENSTPNATQAAQWTAPDSSLRSNNYGLQAASSRASQGVSETKPTSRDDL